MPSRVRIRLTTDGRRIHDTKAVHSLEQMYRRSVEKGFSSKIGVLPEVKWRKAVMLFQNIKQYVHHYDPGMRLLVTRERRGERSRMPAKEPSKVLKVKQAPRWREAPPQRAAVPPLNAGDWPPWNPLEAVQARAVAPAGGIQNAVAGVQNVYWNFNDPNR